MVNEDKAFESSFRGYATKGSVYNDPMGFTGCPTAFKGYSFTKDTDGQEFKSEFQERMAADVTAMAAEWKALTTTTGGAGTAGNAMVPIYVDPRIVDITRKYNPLVELTPRIANMGMTADYNRITAKGGAVWAAEDAALTDTDETFERQSKPIKFAYAKGRVTGPSQAAFPSYTLGGFTQSAAPNAKQLAVTVKTRSLRELEEETIVNGDTGSEANEFDGFIDQMGATNTVDKDTSAISMDDLTTAVQYAYDDGGRPNLCVCSSNAYTDIQKLLFDQFRLSPTTKLSWGYETLELNTMVGRMPVIPSMYMSNVTGSKGIYFLDMSEVEMRVLQDVTYEELAKTNDSEAFLLKTYESYCVKAPEFCSSITEISA